MKKRATQPEFAGGYMAKTNHYFYVLHCADNTFYGGYTVDIERREKEHNEGIGCKYTFTRRPVTLIHYEVFETRSLAMKAEYAFKHQSRAAKERYLSHQSLKEE